MTFDPTVKHEFSPETLAYLRWWYDWATGGAVNGDPFWRCLGLCVGAPHGVRSELSRVFDYADRPFGDANYWRHQYDETQHKDPIRLAWLRLQLGIEQDGGPAA